LFKEVQLYAGFLLAQLENVIIEDFIAKRKPEYNWPSVSNRKTL
jgi:hypothetical protein